MVRKKEEQKVVLPDYQKWSSLKDNLKNDIQNTFANSYDGLRALAEEYRGRRGCRKIEKRLIETFICNDVRATVKIDGLGTYTAEIGDIQVAMDKEKEPSPMLAIWVFRGNEKDSMDADLDIYYDSAWGWTMMDAIDSVTDKLFQAIENAYRKDYSALPEEMRG